jgi:hypothetical protein
MIEGMAEDSPPVRSLLVGLVTLVLVALIIGGVASLFALGAANVAGLASDKGPAPRPSLYVPPLPRDSETPTPSATGPAAVAQSPTLAPSPSATPTHQKRHRSHRISLVASPLHASASERIDLSGSYPGGAGAVLQVQNRQGGRWTDFPVTVPVSGGRFHTYIYTGNPGPHRFRVVDPGSGRASNPVTITIG